MNRGITSAPMNWAIDYGQNRQGEIMGNAIGNTGGMLGNAIMQYAQEKRKKEQEKAKKDAAVRAIMAGGFGKAAGLTDQKSIEQFVSANGADASLNLIKISQDQQQIDQRGKQMEAEANRLRAENDRLKLERETLGKFVSEATTPRVQLPSANAVGAAFNTPGAAIPQATTQAPDPLAAFARNAPNMNAGAGLSALNQILDAKGKPAPDRSNIGKEFKLSDGRTAVWTSGGGIQVLDKPKEQKALSVGDKSDVTIGGVTVKAVYLGGDNFVDDATKAPLYVYMEDPANPFVKIPRPNPLIFGVDAASAPPAAAPGQPTAANPIVPAPAAMQGAPAVKTKAEYDALPSGSEYIDTDGKRKRKK